MSSIEFLTLTLSESWSVVGHLDKIDDDDADADGDDDAADDADDDNDADDADDDYDAR